MRRSMIISLFAIIAAAVIALIATFASGDSPRLGLDLEGGASVVLSPKTATTGGVLSQAQQIISNRVDGLGVAGATIERQGNNIVVELPGVKDATTALGLIGQTAQLEFRPVTLDSNGQEEILSGEGPTTTTTVAPTTTPAAAPASPTPASIAPATSTPTTAGALGLPTAKVGIAGAATAVAAAEPGTQTAPTTPAAAATTATTLPAATTATTAAPASSEGPAITDDTVLDASNFGPFSDGVTNSTTTFTSATAAFTSCPAGSSSDCQTDVGQSIESSTPTGDIPAGTTIVAVLSPTTVTLSAPATGSHTGVGFYLPARNPENQSVVLPLYTGNDITARYILGPVLRDGTSNIDPTNLLTGRIVSTAQATIDSTGQWEVNVTFTGKGGTEWDDVVGKQYYQKYVAIVLDHKVISAPQINAQQFNGQATISGGGSGGFTHSQASSLALVLRYGALPVQLVQSDVQTISASLGKASLRAGLIAGFIGLALVLLYMIFYYRALGLVVVFGLGLSGAFLYSIYTYLGNSSSFNASLSLASVVGIVVSVGVTADSYIVFFERLKDDIRGGKSVRSSVDKSFSRAWRTIWTADVVSIIAAALLYFLTIGDVKGFAFSLGLATLLDLLTAYTFTRPMVLLLGRNRTIAEAKILGVARGLAATPVGGAA